MRNRSVLYFTGFIVAILGLLVFDYSARRKFLNSTIQTRNIATPEVPVVTAAGTQVSDIGQRARFLSRFTNFVTNLNLLSDDPEQSEAFLRDFSLTLKSSDLIVLADVLNDKKMQNDQRILALELLVMNQDFVSHDLINNFVQNENFLSHENQEFEISLRAQAIEGLTLFADKKLVRKNLENLKIRTTHAFLYDRANKALQYLSNANLANPTENNNAEASAP